MRRVRFDLLCDIHHAIHGEEVEAVEEVSMSVAGGKTKTMAFCTDCYNDYFSFVAAAYEQAQTDQPESRRKGRPTRVELAANPVPCPYEGCDSRLRNRHGLGVHMRRQHGVTLKEYEGRAA